MRRVVLIGVATAILVAVPQIAWANILFSNAFWSSYPVIKAHGTGTLTQAGTGHAYGSVVGKAIVRGRVTVTGHVAKAYWNAAGTAETFVSQPGRRMYVSTWGSAWWKFVLKGTSSITGQVRGSASAVGTGQYTVSGRTRYWSSSVYSPLRISIQ
jgi:hypothetical protein